ncbi:MAG: hypothetical protein V5789_00060 [Colwellia sp.]
MTFIKTHTATIGVTCRVFIALFGGFLLANLVAILITYWFVDDKIDGIVTGIMASFIVYTGIVMFVFATKSAGRAAFGVGTACLVTFGIIFTLELAVKR